MIIREKIKDMSGTIDLVRTMSTNSYRLLQKETGILYHSFVIDAIEGYDEDNIPYSRYTYEETDIIDDED